ncbi:hypothetical protein E2C01_067887 [Portunus trituberculatus]|uniref:Uncharacterized protein n=1 Tax=Portunus trituberculatus TaxID=210409 RepID=A0A5B7HYM8_PORTR|nr:hypothetical protein [Portunus trituberculatus]
MAPQSASPHILSHYAHHKHYKRYIRITLMEEKKKKKTMLCPGASLFLVTHPVRREKDIMQTDRQTNTLACTLGRPGVSLCPASQQRRVPEVGWVTTRSIKC